MEWLPDVCSQLHGEMVSIYWMMILPLIVFLVVLEMFKTKGTEPDAGKILTRALASILMLISFKETINLIAFMGDGIADRIDGLAKMPEILQVFSDNFSREAPALYKVRELFIFLLNFLSYFLAYFGIFVTDALIHFCWSILYVCAPLMILCYILENTANISKNLYKGLFTVISWKIMFKKPVSLIVIMSLLSSSCSTTRKSIALGLGTGAASGAVIGAMTNKNHSQGALLGLGIGAVVGSIASYFIHGSLEERDNDTRKETLFNLEKHGVFGLQEQNEKTSEPTWTRQDFLPREPMGGRDR